MTPRTCEAKIMTIDEMAVERQRLREAGKTVVFTNGCFDIIHAGHIDYLWFSRSLGDVLVVGINSDASVKLNKGPTRPIVPQEDRAILLAAFEAIDYVVMFEEKEPLRLIESVLPDILVKGKDWSHYVSGRDIVERNGGKIVLADLVQGRSTTNIIGRVKELVLSGHIQ